MCFNFKRNAVLFLLILSFSISSCSKKVKDVGVASYWKSAYLKISSNDSLHYVSVPSDSAVASLVMIHGSPGDFTVFESYLKDSLLARKFEMYAVDRPAFGKSKFQDKQTLLEQSEVINKLVEEDFVKAPVVVMGHSYGGGVAAYLMALDNEKVKAAVLLAPTLAPDLQKKKYYNYIAKGLSPVIGKTWRSSNREMWTLAEELKMVGDSLKNITGKVYWLHGTKDWLVPYETIDFAQSMVSDSVIDVVTIDKGSHFIPWKNENEVRELIFRALDELD
ncbi:alpha/beta fold hydrolase [Aureibacter tunicatorum]|uniref:Pimeloyl-ACP methyl ester carboxylesterase n=1 Tax=Aureibacter tunicatorum TaxID=866807 RepID=A0AAE4BRD9_9BACT|nr:alpha/beta hydrolase [Aureibacter tunicatorum]MDR6237147.1 pimeloyl-ACP methyl ester carboxylesterase [Aureibacter tunicatorum]BDD06139.1 alpha/beta hydrolase [Aureibacter tunicatorum]